MAKVIYQASDLTTDQHVILVHAPNAFSTWCVTISPLSDSFPSSVISYDSLINAAHAVADAVDNFQDEGTPDSEEVLTTIANYFNDPDKIYVQSEEPDGGGIFLVNEYEWDEV